MGIEGVVPDTDPVSRMMAKIEEMHDQLEAEHKRTPSTFFGKPTKRHHQIVGASRVLLQLHGWVSRELVAVLAAGDPSVKEGLEALNALDWRMHHGKGDPKSVDRVFIEQIRKALLRTQEAAFR